MADKTRLEQIESRLYAGRWESRAEWLSDMLWMTARLRETREIVEKYSDERLREPYDCCGSTEPWTLMDEALRDVLNLTEEDPATQTPKEEKNG